MIGVGFQLAIGLFFGLIAVLVGITVLGLIGLFIGDFLELTAERKIEKKVFLIPKLYISNFGALVSK